MTRTTDDSANLPPEQLTRAQLIERERTQASSKQTVILQDMQRLGFWPSDQPPPEPPAELVQREAQLSQALAAMAARLSAGGDDPQQALRLMRRQRLQAARQRREATRQARAQARYERARSWHERRQHSVLYLGQGVSGGLQHSDNQPERLARWQLPQPANPQQLAQLMGVPVAELRFLAYDRAVARLNHYRSFDLPKKSGGLRRISAPMPRLKRLQYWLLDNILSKVPVHDAAHGFRPGRSICSNAQPHVGKAVVINLDLQDFFPSIAYPRIKGVFRALGYSEQLASIMGLLCTQRPTQAVQLDGQTYHIATGARHLPQGAPSSPALTNILCRRLDRRLHGMAAKLGFAYTRYADDLSFSADAPAQHLVGKLLWRARQIITDEGFTLHPDKLHVMRNARRQQVTGLVVNAKPSIDRSTFKRFRATVFQVEKDGPQGKSWNGNDNVLDALLGYAHFLHMVDPQRSQPWLQRVQALRVAAQAPAQSQPSPAPQQILESESAAKASQAGRGRSAFRRASAQGQAPWAHWWQPAQPPAPVLEPTEAQRQAQRQRQAQAHAALPTAAQPQRQGALEPQQPPEEAQHASQRNPRMLLEQTLALLVLLFMLRKPSLLLVGLLIHLAYHLLHRSSWWLFLPLLLASLLVPF
ncbi:reverse transcriptase family protein [Vandammella animalimorsus]|uniref:RNA-directed DNA polymerase n=1 Tax=Vandammella animalimorsus TaxID=2029117 RepID=A0A2A2AZ99_9BURK|nr:reverse transcriptase family protein [Vandammella animalimorsus]PAT43097.1 RNA-dependent DNA polymerase [Vandammella animalimorsus]